MGVTYDTGALIAADRGERRMWARHRALLTLREVPTVPAPVVAQSWRGGGRQALLSGCWPGATSRRSMTARPAQSARSPLAPRPATSWTHAWLKEPSAAMT